MLHNGLGIMDRRGKENDDETVWFELGKTETHSGTLIELASLEILTLSAVKIT